MEQGTDYHFENVWLDKTDLLKDEIKQFWLANGALPEESDADVRADQVLLVVRDASGQIAGVSSAYRDYVRRLGDYFYLYRTFIAERLRRTRVATEVLVASVGFLEEHNRQLTADRSLGIFLEVEAETLKYGGLRVKRAIWEESRFVFIGRDRHGAHLRVYYFEDALIEPLRSRES